MAKAAAASISDERVSVIHNNLGFAFHKKQQLDVAAAHYRQAIELKPDDARAHNNLGVVMHVRGQAFLAQCWGTHGMTLVSHTLK